MKKIISLLLAVTLILGSVSMLATIAEAPVITGDVDRNQTVNSTDALLALQKAASKKELDEVQSWCADVDDNGSVTSTDALMILQAASGKKDLPPREYDPTGDIKAVAISGVTEPVGGEAATTEGITVSTEGCKVDTLNTYWVQGGNKFTGEFVTGTTYTVRVVLEPNGRDFDDEVTATIDGKEAAVEFVGIDSISVTLDYVASVPVGPKPIIIDIPEDSVIQNGAYEYDETADNSFMITTEGLPEKTIVAFAPGVYRSSNVNVKKDFARFVYSLQGLINRDFGNTHTCLLYEGSGLEEELDIWLSLMCEEGKMLEGYDVVQIKTFDDFFDMFTPQIVQCGISLWDQNVPSTANVAATICGLEGPLPVKYDTQPKGFYKKLMDTAEEYEVEIEVKYNFVGKFTGSGNIPDIDMKSTGSAKCDAYYWALEKYMDRCSSKYIAYTVDGWPCLDGVAVSSTSDAGSPQMVCLPNHDYLIARRCFFFDLTCYPNEIPCDDPDQPKGTDAATMTSILEEMYDRNNGDFAVMMGFPPWWLKYTQSHGHGSLPATTLEWMSVEVFTCYNLAKEADAAQPCAMCNGSVMYKYVTPYKDFVNNEPTSTEKFDSNTYYYLFYMGDYDSSAWMDRWVPNFWGDSARGSIPLMWSFNPNLSYRIPVIWEYIYRYKTANDYFVAGEGAGYIIPSALYEGHTNYGFVERTNEDGAAKWVEYSKPFYKMFDMDITGFIINGTNQINKSIMGAYANFNTVGAFSNSGSHLLSEYNGVYYVYLMNGLGNFGDTNYTSGVMYSNMFNRGNNFCAYRTVCWAPSEVKAQADAYATYAEAKGKTVKYVDPYTYFRLIKESGQAKHIS